MVLICRNNGIQLYSCTCKQIISLPLHVNLRLRERLDCSTQAPPQMWSLPHFLFLLKTSNFVRFWWIFKYELLKDKKEKTKATKYRLAQQPKKKFCNKMNTLWDLLVPQNIYPEHLSIHISWEKKNHTAKGKDVIVWIYLVIWMCCPQTSPTENQNTEAELITTLT